MKFARKKNSNPCLLVLTVCVALAICGCKSGTSEPDQDNASLSPDESHQAMLEQLAAIAKESKNQNAYFGNSRQKQPCQRSGSTHHTARTISCLL